MAPSREQPAPPLCGCRPVMNVVDAIAVDHIPAAIVAVDREGFVITWNRRAAEILGAVPADAIASRLPYFFPEPACQCSCHVRSRITCGYSPRATPSIASRTFRQSGASKQVAL